MKTALKFLGFAFVVWIIVDLVADFTERRIVKRILSSPGWENEKEELENGVPHQPEFVGATP